MLKIQVIRADGNAEVLTLTDPIVVTDKCITTGTSCQHFFTDEGIYDGWGMPFSAEIPEGEDPLEHVRPFIEAVEKDREIVGGSEPTND